jgi:hypothetical protein
VGQSDGSNYQKWKSLQSHCVILFFLLVFAPSTGFSKGYDSPVSLVVDYVNSVGSGVLISGLNGLDKYFDPDFMSLGGDYLNYPIVNRDFKVGRALNVYEDHNFDHPHKQKLVLVEIVFNEIGRFDGTHKVIIARQKYIKPFYCSKSNGKYLILDTDDNDLWFSFCDAAIAWLKTNGHEESNQPALAKLEATNCK